jgi:DNA-binding transcriptional regulator LsrR (DeoR family)
MDPQTSPTLRSEADATDQLIEISTWFYLYGWSQVKIAKALGLDPSTVSRHLKRARDEGIVRIDIRRPPATDAGLGRSVAELYGLARVVVVSSTSDDPTEAVAIATAEQVDGLLRTGLRLGVSWGRTLASVVRHLHPMSVSNLTITQLAGGIDTSTPGIHGYDLVRALVGLYPGSEARYLHAPAIVDSLAIRDALLKDSGISGALEVGAQCELALVGIGSMDPNSTLASGRHISPNDREELLRAGAVGNMNTRFFDGAGRPVGKLDDRTIAISWEQLARIPTVLAVAAGDVKAVAVDAAIRTGCIDVLVIDDSIARQLLPGRLVAPAG